MSMICRKPLIDPCEDAVDTYEAGEGVYAVPVRAASTGDGDWTTDSEFGVSTVEDSPAGKVRYHSHVVLLVP
jgi:hypothetical protein